MQDLVYKSRLKDFLNSKDMRTDGDLPEALSKRVNEILNKAIHRAQKNGRKTVRPEDL